MFIPILAAAVVATAFAQLGAMFVWAKLLSGALGLLMLILIGIGSYALWKRYRTRA